MNAIAYVRVSSKRQGKSGLGLEAQRQAIYSFCKTEGMTIIGNFMDVESGGKDEREGLHNALMVAKENDATIVVAKLDRLSREVHYISGLMKEGVPFVSAELGKDVPSFMLHIYASFAELERSMIRKRVKESLAVAKSKGVKLGTSIPKVKEACQKANRQRGDKTLDRLSPHIAKARSEGSVSLREMAEWLNAKGIHTARGKEWTKASLSPTIKRLKLYQPSLFQEE
tara:strand:+ start:766 stop:1446 length:681 start_codon:yes stop_codon:yes gene_type:complete